MILRLALAALLLFAQHMALAHRAAHAPDAESFTSRLDRHDGTVHSELCAFHGDLETLLGAAETASPRLYPAEAVFAQISAASGRHEAAEPVAPASRGPPPLLRSALNNR